MLILCPLDFSAGTPELLAYAAALAAGTGAELRLLHVCEPRPSLAQPETPDPVEASCTKRLYELRQVAEQSGAAHVSTGIVKGEAATEILAYAQQQSVACIVIGAHGRTGLTRFLMGSTAEAVLRMAPCPTLLVRFPATVSETSSLTL